MIFQNYYNTRRVCDERLSGYYDILSLSFIPLQTRANEIISPATMKLTGAFLKGDGYYRFVIDVASLRKEEQKQITNTVLVKEAINPQ
jgi:hypothetical protein